MNQKEEKQECDFKPSPLRGTWLSPWSSADTEPELAARGKGAGQLSPPPTRLLVKGTLADCRASGEGTGRARRQPTHAPPQALAVDRTTQASAPQLGKQVPREWVRHRRPLLRRSVQILRDKVYALLVMQNLEQRKRQY